MDTVWERISMYFEDEHIARYLKNILFDENFSAFNSKHLKRFLVVYKHHIPLVVRQRVIDRIIEDFNLPYNIQDHFVARLLCRFKNKPINFIFDDIKRAYKRRKAIGNDTEGSLRGQYIKIIYNRINNEVVTVFEPKLMDVKLGK